MKCSRCGKENPENSIFCKNCYKSLREEAKQNKSLEAPENNENIVNNNKVKNQTNRLNEVKESITEDEVYNNGEFIIYCKCGQRIDKNNNYCPKCNRPITFTIKKNDNMDQKEDKDTAKMYLILYLCFIAASIFTFSFLCLIPATIIIIAGKINCPKSKPIKVLFWITIIIVSLMIILMLVLISLCGSIAGAIAPNLGEIFEMFFELLDACE